VERPIPEPTPVMKTVLLTSEIIDDFLIKIELNTDTDG
jgi:hypothetical protein